MNRVDRILIAGLAMGIWTLVALQAAPAIHAQEADQHLEMGPTPVQMIHANDIVGLSAFVQQSVRDHQFRPQSMPGLDQYIRSVVRNCRVNGSISGDRLTATSISC